MAIGQKALVNTVHQSSGGGGGSFVARKNNVPLLVAGGGGGLENLKKRLENCDASNETSGKNNKCVTPCGNWQIFEGKISHVWGKVTAFVTSCFSYNNDVGGFGGGGGAYGFGGGAGGGGGYSGGASGDNVNGSCGGGGGSYNVGKNQVNKPGFNN
ncbi:heterogeneous nuclear ribonucleoprotein A3-like [Xenia sp. Carnegie-2017]|uniref:heterogeneous nuclear ribonucleoprotein A3-like n=1 Tax=Xenia sp. Carnegie-2017 TaxID=2897299 RepID=UPI001F03452A|nr:heterogeneous nuclear ribonucleoprotein A3-like [Xenia sp. Carnegie-2017]